jgi:hypothetical protein
MELRIRIKAIDLKAYADNLSGDKGLYFFNTHMARINGMVFPKVNRINRDNRAIIAIL